MALSAIRRLDRIRLNCRNSQTLARFFVKALGFSPSDRPSPEAGVIALSLGGSRLDLAPTPPSGQKSADAVPGWSLRFQHFAMIVPDMAAAMTRLSAVRGWMAISTAGPQQLPATSGGVVAFKFRDPEGHPLELIAASSGPSPSPASARIDHSAISVADTARSVEFYRGLGLQTGAASCNHGPEQERLDGLPHAVVDVRTLNTDDPGPHLELLRYHGAHDREGVGADIDDLAATRMVLIAADQKAVEAIATAYATHVVSTSERGVLLRDPDGHILQVET